MTANTLTPDTETRSTSSADLGTDPRPLFAKAVAIAEPVIAGVRLEQLDLPSPCVEYSVKELLDHLVFVLHRVAALGRGDDAFSPKSMADAPNDRDDWTKEWRTAAAEMRSAWADDGVLDKVMVLPWATMTGAEVLSMYVSEITTHTWDLATATGQQPAWDDAVCRLGLAAMHRDLPMADRTPMWEAFRAQAPANMQFDPPFANAVAVPLDAPLIDQLVAWTGRQP
ncbi:MAG TPA: TIGR03086 family metal-binding protein [Ilumatobacteraceae bacterium]